MEENRIKRSSLKAQHPNWKQKLRDNCLKRVREERHNLLWKLRATGQQDENQRAGKENVKSAFRNIFLDELQRIRQPTVIDSEINSLSKNDDSLWEYDGLNLDSYSNEGENQDLLIEMENALYADIRDESIRRELELYEEEDEYLARVVFEQMQLNDEQNDKLWCPICKQGYLQETHYLIYCTRCNLRLDCKSDKVNLNFLRDRLGEVHIEHLDRGCEVTPAFHVETVFDLTALYICCQLCGTFEIVI